MCAEYFPGMTSRISGIGVTGIQSQSAEDVHAKRLVERWHGSAHRRLLQGAQIRRDPRMGSHRRCTCCKWPATARRIELWKQYTAPRCAVEPANPLCATCWTSNRWANRCGLEEVESITSIRKRFVTPGMSLGALSPGGAQDPERCDEPHWREIRQRRGWRRSGTLSCRNPMATTRRPRSNRSHPGRFRGHCRIPEPMRRA